MEEVQQDPTGHGALKQGSIIPIGWTPTPAKPVPVVRCIVIKKNGDRCGRWSLRGHTKCTSHLRGANRNFPTVREHIEAVVEAARMRLVDSTDEAIDTLHTLMEPGTADAVRLKAATEILDRAGIRGGFEIDVEVTDKTDPAEILVHRLEKLRERMVTERLEGEVLEGVVLEDDTVQQEVLF